MANFYSIEYFVDGEVDIKHAEMTDEQLAKLTNFLNKKGVKFTIYNLSKSSCASDVISLNVRDLLGGNTPTGN